MCEWEACGDETQEIVETFVEHDFCFRRLIGTYWLLSTGGHFYAANAYIFCKNVKNKNF
jgi:hypothetical protein